MSDGRRIMGVGGEGDGFVVSHAGNAIGFSGACVPLSLVGKVFLQKRQILPSASLSSSDRDCSGASTRSCQQPAGALFTPLAPQIRSRSAARVRPTYRRRRYSSHAASMARARACAMGPASLSLATPQIRAVAFGGAPALGTFSRRGGCAPSGRVVV